jgi:ammonia channel protein AmtB
MRFSAMLIFSSLWLILVYAPICHWVWGGGWLGNMGLQDFAGGSVVHITAGVAALIAATVNGREKGIRLNGHAPSQPDHDSDWRGNAVGRLVWF